MLSPKTRPCMRGGGHSAPPERPLLLPAGLGPRGCPDDAGCHRALMAHQTLHALSAPSAGGRASPQQSLGLLVQRGTSLQGAHCESLPQDFLVRQESIVQVL